MLIIPQFKNETTGKPFSLMSKQANTLSKMLNWIDNVKP